MDESIKPSEQKELDAYRQREAESVRSQAINDALAGHALVPGAAQQIAALIGQEVKVISDDAGRKVAVAPGFTPVKQFIDEQMARPEYAHFRRGNSAAPPPLVQQPGENLGQFLLRGTLAERAAFVGPDANPATNLRLPFGTIPK